MNYIGAQYIPPSRRKQVEVEVKKEEEVVVVVQEPKVLKKEKVEVIDEDDVPIEKHYILRLPNSNKTKIFREKTKLREPMDDIRILMHGTQNLTQIQDADFWKLKMKSLIVEWLIYQTLLKHKKHSITNSFTKLAIFLKCLFVRVLIKKKEQKIQES